MNRLWVALIVILIILAYVLPYTLLTGVNAWYGSFLLWGLTGLLVIVANFFLTRNWRD